MPPGPRDAPGRPQAWLFFAVYAAGFVLWTLLTGASTSPHGKVSALLASLGFLPLNLGAVYWLLRAADGSSVGASERKALQLLAGMYFCTAIGNTMWSVDEVIRGVDPRYSWANLFYIGSYALGIAGLSQIPVAPRVPMERRRFLLDAACVVLSMAALIWTFVVSSINWQALNSLHLLIELVYPIGSIITLALLCRLIMRQGPNALRTDILWLALGLFIQCTMDLVFELDYRQELTRLTTWAALICAAMYVVIIYGAQLLLSRKTSADEPRTFAVLHPMNLLPTIAAISVYVVLLWVIQSNQREALGILIATCIALNVLFFLKQTLAAEENAVLQAARADAESRARYETLAREGQRLESVGRLAGGIAHDFNNLLTTVLANSDFALTRLRPGDAAHDEVTDIRSAAMRGAELIRQLLAFSRKSVIAPVRLQPDLVLREMERLLQRLAGDRCALLLELPADLGQVQADRGQLEQVLANLVSNARDSMADGGGIVISGRNVTLSGALAAELALPAGEYVSLSVQDSGVGISSEVRTHIFEPFFSTKARGKGTGLGLASTYGIMRQSNGGIGVESVVGRGSVFTLYLPRVYAAPTAAVSTVVAAPEDVQSGRGETVLLVEDDAAVRQVTRRMLASEGYHVLTAADAVAAHAIFNQHGEDIALMITDVMMPGDSGFTLATSVRERWPSLAVIYISGYSDTELPNDERVKIGDDFLHKPFTGAQLMARIEAHLSTRRPSSPRAVRSR